MKFDLVVTRHQPLVQLLLERGLIDESVPVIDHVKDPAILKDKNVVGVLPHNLSCHCLSITEIPMSLTPGDRKALAAGDLSLERTREVAGNPVVYKVVKIGRMVGEQFVWEEDGACVHGHQAQPRQA